MNDPSADNSAWLFVKKAAGLALAFVGMLLAAHGGATGQTWELWLGVLLVAIGAVLLVLKIMRRNAEIGGERQSRP
jgi:hypothetical protein